MVERSAVNRLVVGSNPTSGANFRCCLEQRESPGNALCFGFSACGTKSDAPSGRQSSRFGSWGSPLCRLRPLLSTRLIMAANFRPNRPKDRQRQQPVRRSFRRSLVGSSVSERSRKNDPPSGTMGPLSYAGPVLNQTKPQTANRQLLAVNGQPRTLLH